VLLWHLGVVLANQGSILVLPKKGPLSVPIFRVIYVLQAAGMSWPLRLARLQGLFSILQLEKKKIITAVIP